MRSSVVTMKTKERTESDDGGKRIRSVSEISLETHGYFLFILGVFAAWLDRLMSFKVYERRITFSMIIVILINLAGIIAAALSPFQPLLALTYLAGLPLQPALAITASHTRKPGLVVASFLFSSLVMIYDALRLVVIINWLVLYDCWSVTMSDAERCLDYTPHLGLLLAIAPVQVYLCRQSLSLILALQEQKVSKQNQSLEMQKVPVAEDMEVDLALDQVVRRRTYPQMVVVYTALGLIVALSAVLGWAPEIQKIPNLIPYLGSCAFVLETSRYYLRHDTHSPWPLYLNLIPLVILSVISREAHSLVSLVFFFSTIVLRLQVMTLSSKKIRIHHLVRIFTLVYVAVYAVAVVIIHYFWSDPTGRDPWRGARLKEPINISFEIVIGVSLLLSGFGLGEYARVYIASLSDRIRAIKKLNVQKWALQQEIRHLQSIRTGETPLGVHVDLDAPINKALSAVRNLSRQTGLNPEQASNLQMLMNTLSSEDNVFAPRIDEQTLTQMHPDLARSGTMHRMARRTVANDARPVVPTGFAHLEGKMVPSPHRLRGGSLDGSSSTSSLQLDEKTALPDSTSTVDAIFAMANSGSLTEITSDPKLRSQLEWVCKNVSSWSFDPLMLSRESGRPLFLTGMALFNRFKIVEKFKIPVVVLSQFLTAIEAGYLRNPYHNMAHAADVLATVGNFLNDGLSKELSDLEIFAILLSCVGHDYGHPGRNNPYLVATASDLALQFNDHSPLENYHTAALFALVRKEEFNVLKNLSADDHRELRRLVIHIILATDLSEHFTFVNKFKQKVEACSLDMEKQVDRDLVLAMAIKAADVSNPAKPKELALAWTACVMAEFYAQGDSERQKGFPLSKYMDRTLDDVRTCQLGFIEYIVRPVFEVWGTYLNITKYGEIISDNYKMWEALSDQAARALLEKTAGETIIPSQPHGLIVSRKLPGSGDLKTNSPSVATLATSDMPKVSIPSLKKLPQKP